MANTWEQAKIRYSARSIPNSIFYLLMNDIHSLNARKDTGPASFPNTVGLEVIWALQVQNYALQGYGNGNNSYDYQPSATQVNFRSCADLAKPKTEVLGHLLCLSGFRKESMEEEPFL